MVKMLIALKISEASQVFSVVFESHRTRFSHCAMALDGCLRWLTKVQPIAIARNDRTVGTSLYIKGTNAE